MSFFRSASAAITTNGNGGSTDVGTWYEGDSSGAIDMTNGGLGGISPANDRTATDAGAVMTGVATWNANIRRRCQHVGQLHRHGTYANYFQLEYANAPDAGPYGGQLPPGGTQIDPAGFWWNKYLRAGSIHYLWRGIQPMISTDRVADGNASA
jgi:hypothetical protein